MRVFLLVSAAVAIVAVAFASQRVAAERGAGTRAAPVALLASPDVPIAAEAQVFRTAAGMLAIEPALGPRRAAHPRSLATWRSLRAYPGAPPRIPHGLTPTEFRTGGCTTCHERGGYSQRFGAYVPITPHPEMGACLQCHVGDATLMAIGLPSTDPSARCRQCHAEGATRWTESSAWTTLEWPQTVTTTPGQSPPPIPHTLHLRGNCLACHAPPTAVAEIRTSHPERANCRQCHVTAAPNGAVFVRPAPPTAAQSGGAP
ncbi:MAG: multiheme c-type cytochrome [Gemmatimonadaceae bacterium]